VFGANGGLLSTASLMAGVAAASASSAQLILTGFKFGDKFGDMCVNL
jgi:VIT1/CCC1 family predicted Fe2+/Mn2+ transporter